MKPYTVAVRTLCEFAARQGDLDLRFTPSPTSQQGIAGHTTVRASRNGSYRSELAVSGEYRQLLVRGRADGFDPERRRVEEVKTCVGDVARIPPNHRYLHWAQAKVYGALLCRQFGLSGIEVALVYFDIREQRELPALAECHSAPALIAFFEALCDRFLAWAALEAAHRQARDEALTRLKFPHASFRHGQRDLAVAVYKAARAGQSLLAQAPTGSGKTIGTLFPMLKACPGAGIDKVFFVTAKGSARSLALTAIETLRVAEPALPLRALELTAREKACEHPDKACHGESCPLARNFYDRLPAARSAAAAAAGTLTRAVLRDVALAHGVCPYYLGQEMAQWSDVIVADYNHYFDRGALLHASMQANGWRVGLLVDEAHNLPERTRAMYSASLGIAGLRRARAASPAGVRRCLDRLRRSWSKLGREATAAYSVVEKPPQPLAAALREACSALTEHLSDSCERTGEELLDFYFDALALDHAIDDFGSHSLFDIVVDAAVSDARRGPDSVLSVRNVVPAHFLKARFAEAHSAVLFSATLMPWRFYLDILGLPQQTDCIDVRSSFVPEQLAVRIVRDVSTRYRDRAGSLAPIADLIGSHYERSPGNYLAYVSSYDYLQQLVDAFSTRHPLIPLWQQARHMSDAQREGFLERFVPQGRGIGFAVLGGVFGEGIDLVGTRLVGVFVATLGLPQVNEVNEEMRRRLDRLFGSGYDYTYLFPGIRKVVQAAGRVLRTESDRGSVHLIDDRFTRPEVLRLLPGWWRIEHDSARPAGGSPHRVAWESGIGLPSSTAP